MTAPALPVCRLNWARKPAFEDLVVSYAPVAYYRCSESSGTNAFDRVGGNHATYAGGATLGAASLLAGESATAVTLNGSSGYFSAPDATSLDVADTFSVVAVVKRAATGVKHQILARGATAVGLYIGTDNKVHVEKMGTADVATSSSTIDTTAHIIVATKTGATTAVYVDGLDVTSAGVNQTCAATATSMYMGQDGSSANWFNGVVDDIAVFSTVLTPAQVFALYIAFAQGEFGGAIDNIAVAKRIESGTRKRGRNADRSGDQNGSLNLVISNLDGFFTDERNLAPKTLDAGVDWLNLTAVASIGAAATSLSIAADPATGGGSYCGVASLSSTVNSMVWFALEGTFPSGKPVSASVKLKSVSGNANVQVFIASQGTPADLAGSAGTISGSYGIKTATLTPSGTRSDLMVGIRTTTAAVAVVKFAQLQVNRGAAANAYLEAPTWASLQGGTPLHLYATYSATSYPLFYGFTQRITPTPNDRRVQIVATDPLSTYDQPVSFSMAASTHYSLHWAAIDAAVRSVGGSYRNLCVNGSFEGGSTAGWTLAGGTAASNAAAWIGSYSLAIPNGGTGWYNAPSAPVAIINYRVNAYYTLTFHARYQTAGSGWLRAEFGSNAATLATVNTGQGGQAALTGSFQTYSVTWQVPQAEAGILPYVLFTGIGRDAYVDGVQIVEGLVPQDYTDYGTPVGRQVNQVNYWGSVEAAPIVAQGWSNLCSNPEAVSALTGYSSNIIGTEVVQGFDNVARSTYSTGSITPGANRLILATVTNVHGTSANTVTLSGNSLTWVSVATILFNSNKNRLTVFRAMGASPTAGSITITIGSSQTDIGCGWSVFSFTSVDTSGTNGSGAVVQSVTNSAASGTTLSATLAAGAQAINGTFFAGGVSTNNVITGTSDWGVGTNENLSISGGGAMRVQYAADFNATPTMTVSTSAWGAIAVEIKVASGTQTNISRLTSGGYAAGAYSGGFGTAIKYAPSVHGGAIFFPLGVTNRNAQSYTMQVYVDGTFATGAFKAGFGSQGTSTDVAPEVSISAGIVSGVGQRYTLTWSSLLADRTDGYFYIRCSTYTASTYVQFTGVSVTYDAVSRTYARTGVASPSALTEVATLTSVADGTVHPTCTSFTTYAVAGSGVVIASQEVPRLSGLTCTMLVALKASAGTPSVAIGLGFPYGTAADLATTTLTLSTSWQTFVLKWTATGNDFTDKALVYLMTTAASAITVYADEPQMLIGTAIQPFIPAEAGGVDTLDAGIMNTYAVANQNAIALLSNLNAANLGHHYAAPQMSRPWWKYTSTSRAAYLAKTVVESYADGDLPPVNLVGNLQKDRDSTYQAVVVTYRTDTITPVTGVAANPQPTAVVSAVASSTVRKRAGGVPRVLTIDGTAFLNGPVDTTSPSVVQAIANLELARYQVTRMRPQLRTANRFPSMLQRAPDDLVDWTFAQQNIAALPLLYLSDELTIGKGAMRWDALIDSEEFVTA